MSLVLECYIGNIPCQQACPRDVSGGQKKFFLLRFLAKRRMEGDVVIAYGKTLFVRVQWTNKIAG